MINWTNIRPALLTLFEDLSGLQTVWHEKRRPYVKPKDQAIVLLAVRSAQGVGIDDRRYRDTGESIPDYPYRESANGHRLVSLDIRVESFRHDDDRFAFNAAETIRTRLGWRSSHEALLAHEVAIVTKGETLDVSGLVQDDRVTSVAVFEAILGVGVCEEDTKHPVPAIETVNDPQGTFSP
jgi:hypothetical protein